MIPAGTLLGAVQVAIPGAPVIGQVDPSGRLVNLGKLDGWWDAPPSTGTITQKVNDSGAFIGPAYYGPRVMAVEARIDGFNPGDSMLTAQQILRAVSVDALFAISVTDEAETLTAQVRQEGDPLLARKGNRVVVNLSLIAPDPRRYGAAVTASTGLPTTTGGLVLPFTLPVSLNATSATGTITAVNTGDITSFPMFIASGPIAGPWSISDGAGRVLTSQDTIPAGRTMVIDTGKRTALLDGVANRVMTGTWPLLAPGANQYRFTAASYDPASQLSITYKSARR